MGKLASLPVHSVITPLMAHLPSSSPPVGSANLPEGGVMNLALSFLAAKDKKEPFVPSLICGEHLPRGSGLGGGPTRAMAVPVPALRGQGRRTPVLAGTWATGVWAAGTGEEHVLHPPHPLGVPEGGASAEGRARPPSLRRPGDRMTSCPGCPSACPSLQQMAAHL